MCVGGKPPRDRAPRPPPAAPTPGAQAGRDAGLRLPAVGSAGRRAGRAAGPGRQIPQPRCHFESIARGSAPPRLCPRRARGYLQPQPPSEGERVEFNLV